MVSIVPGTLQQELIALPGWRIVRAERGGLPGCSLIVPTYERPAALPALLTALGALPDPPEEVVIVDGSPHWRTGNAVLGWAGDRALPFDLVYARAPRGLTRQRNAGIDLCAGAYVFFLDDDALPEPGYFNAIRRAFEGNPEVGGIGGAIVNQMDRPISRRWRIRLALGLAPCVEPGVYHACGASTPRGLLKPFTGLREVDLLPGCAFAFRREVLDEFRFSEFFAGYSQGEDVEMSLRVGRQWKLASCGEARVAHDPAAGGRPGGFSKGRMEVRNRYFIWKRHVPHPRLLDGARFWGDVAFLCAMDAARLAFGHGCGVAAAAVECVVAPPRYVEPVAQRRYRLDESTSKVKS